MLGITRFGLAKMKESVLMLASVSKIFVLIIFGHVTIMVYSGAIWAAGEGGGHCCKLKFCP